MNPKRETRTQKVHRSHSLCLPIAIQLRTEAEGARPHPDAKSILQGQEQPGAHQASAQVASGHGHMRGTAAGCVLQGAGLFIGEVMRSSRSRLDSSGGGW